jgi:hypothetical protein
MGCIRYFCGYFATELQGIPVSEKSRHALPPTSYGRRVPWDQKMLCLCMYFGPLRTSGADRISISFNRGSVRRRMSGCLFKRSER